MWIASYHYLQSRPEILDVAVKKLGGRISIDLKPEQKRAGNLYFQDTHAGCFLTRNVDIPPDTLSTPKEWHVEELDVVEKMQMNTCCLMFWIYFLDEPISDVNSVL